MRLLAWLIGCLLLAASAPHGAWAGNLPPLQGDMRKLIVPDQPKPVAAASFQDEKGVEITLEAFKGKVVLVNLWATWCIPCRAEMPSLERLQTLVNDPGFALVAVAQDRGGREKVEKFLAEINTPGIKPYLDTSMKSGRAWGAYGLPTTILIGRDGREVARLVGEAHWDAPEAVAVIKALLAP
jgi:thiol-disulfide isomerase/thioredoxin